MSVTRREVLKIGAVASVASSCARAVSPGKFFTAEEFALVDDLSEAIIPADAHSPGARAAKVAAFIDGQLAEAFDKKDQTDWRRGLKTFLDTAPGQRVALLTRLSEHEATPQTDDERFFVDLKARVVHAYYSSEIGIKQELEYKGNSFLQDFVGTDVSRG